MIEARWERAGFLHYPMWIPLIMDGSAVAAGLMAAGQRAGQQSLAPAVGLITVAVAPWLVGFGGVKLRWWLFAGPVIGGAVVTMVLYPVEFDFAVFLLVLMAGHLGATETPLRSAAATAVAGAVLVVLDQAGHFNGSQFWLAALVVGWDVGFMLQYQQRRLDEQQKSQATRAAQSALEERQRIAREVHDVVAHSLSVTMLHLTAARRDLEEEGPLHLDDAVEALREAERVGRQAMTEIRRSVGLLGSGPGLGATPAPHLTDVPDLVAEFAQAGLAVELQMSSRAKAVPAGTGMAGYRIVQESLSNVAKHAPGSPANVRVDVTDTAVQICVASRLAGTSSRIDHLGSGIRGMQDRARLLGGQLSAGPAGSTWRIDATLPVSPQDAPESRRTSSLYCPISDHSHER